jgi:hypothetical protein
MRFVVVQEPTDTWAVFDTIVNVPADFANHCLMGLTRNEAEWLAARCNQALRSVRRVQNTTQSGVPLRFMLTPVDEAVRRQAP